ncbi:MAG: ATP-dependent sacrificial sulfur transferase LarE [Pseudomonadota bacterium]
MIGLQLYNKYKSLTTSIASLESVLVAYSGGVDSTLLLRVAADILHDRVLAVIAASPTLPDEELQRATAAAEKMKVRFLTITSHEMDNPDFVRNDKDRCYYCKSELFSVLKGIAQQEKLAVVIDGSNYDDRSDYRPGSRAAREFGVRSPLMEAGLTKEDVRALSKHLDLPTWDLPSLACLSSRIPYGTAIDETILQRIAGAERCLKTLGFMQVRVRDYGDTARIEVPEGDLALAITPAVRSEIVACLKRLGYLFITLDLEGYSTGSMNRTLVRALS